MRSMRWRQQGFIGDAGNGGPIDEEAGLKGTQRIPVTRSYHKQLRNPLLFFNHLNPIVALLSK